LSGGPRNRQAVERGQEQREQIKRVLLDHERFPLRRRLSGKQLREHFPHLGLSTILWHVAAIRDEADAAAKALETV
jgi:hypothetical protein